MLENSQWLHRITKYQMEMRGEVVKNQGRYKKEERDNYSPTSLGKIEQSHTMNNMSELHKFEHSKTILINKY